MKPILLAVAALTALTAARGAAALDDLIPPIQCEIGKKCFIQNYVDRDPGPGFLDYRCGRAGYDTHGGVDFALQSAKQMRDGVAVIAAASGVVRGVRDGVADTGKPEKPGERCGNGVMIDHGEGWTTQYCHLRQNSVAVRVGQDIAAGQPLGLVGRSGDADFPHVHFHLRKDGVAVDPFTGPDASSDGCDVGGSAMWRTDDHDLSYAPAKINLIGFSAGVPDWDAIEQGARYSFAVDQPLVAYVDVRNLPKGWTVGLAMLGPDKKSLARQVYKAEKHRARQYLHAGVRPPSGRWAADATYYNAVEIRNADGERTDSLIVRFNPANSRR